MQSQSQKGFFELFLVLLYNKYDAFSVIKQVGREEDSFWKDTVPEPHHTYHAMGETYPVHTYCTHPQPRLQVMYNIIKSEPC